MAMAGAANRMALPAFPLANAVVRFERRLK